MGPTETAETQPTETPAAQPASSGGADPNSWDTLSLNASQQQQPEHPPSSAAPAYTPPTSAAGSATNAPAPSTANSGNAAEPDAAEPKGMLTPVHKGGLIGIASAIFDAISGAPHSVYQDADGKNWVRNPDPQSDQPFIPAASAGSKWGRIAAEGFRGAAAGFAAGKGGNPGAALQAGVQVGDKDAKARQEAADKRSDAEKQDKLDQFNHVKQLHDAAAADFALTRLKTKATEEDVKFSQEQIDREKTLGSADLGVFDTPAALAKVQQQDPEFWKHVYAGDVVRVPEIGPDGERQGTHVFLRTHGIGDEILPPGSKALRYVSGAKPGDEPTLQEFTLVGTHTRNQRDSYTNAAQTQLAKWHTDKEAAEEKEQKKQLTGEQIKTQRSEQAAHYATANKANAEATKVRTEGASDDALVDMIGTGRVNLGRLNYVAARKPEILDAVAKKYPDFDSSKIDGYSGTYKDFTEGTTSRQLNAGGTALKHLKELRDMNTVKSHFPGSPDYNAYQNKADTLATELARFYGDATIPAIAAIKSTLASTLPGTRQKAINTQAESMGDKLDSFEHTWTNAAPSKAYQAPMPFIDEKAKEARAALDPRYRQRITQEQGGNPQPAPRTNAPVTPQRPPNVPANAVWNAQGNNGRGMWQLPQ